MRAAAIDGVFLLDRFLWAAALNVVYLALGLAAFLFAFRIARHRGQLLQMGE
jgi:ABC-2 type transport system permease protein